MPAFLTPDAYDQWLSPTKLSSDEDRESMVAWLRDVSSTVAGSISTYEVDRRVNNSRTADPLDPGLIDPRDA